MAYRVLCRLPALCAAQLSDDRAERGKGNKPGVGRESDCHEHRARKAKLESELFSELPVGDDLRRHIEEQRVEREECCERDGHRHLDQ